VFKLHPCLIGESSESESQPFPEDNLSSIDEGAEEDKEDSEPSVDNIELTVSTINTENLQVMKEKPIVSLIK
jgi:hypothetical protein